jgi:hypothetical protein
MVNKLFPLNVIAVFGVVFMLVGVYIALAQDASQTMTVAISQMPGLAINSELSSSPDTQLAVTQPDGQVQQGTASTLNFAQFITPSSPLGVYQVTMVKPGESPRSYTFEVLSGEQVTIPTEWATAASASPVVIPPTEVPQIVVQPTQVLPTATLEPTQVILTATLEPTEVVEQPIEVIPTEVIEQPTDVMLTAIVEATESVEQPTEVMPTAIVEATEVIGQATEILPTAIVEATEAVEQATVVIPTQVVQPTQMMPQANMPTATIGPTQVIEQPTQVAATPIPVDQSPTQEQTPVMGNVTPTVVLSTPVPSALGKIAGVVLYENTQKQVTIRLNLTRLDITSEIIETVSDSSGAFQFADLALGIYRLNAFAPGFLSAQLEVRVLEGGSIQLPTTTLKAGDTNQDGLIDIKDVTLVAANFNGPAAIVETDINGDGWVDIRDLSVVGSQFGLAGPLPWN